MTYVVHCFQSVTDAIYRLYFVALSSLNFKYYDSSITWPNVSPPFFKNLFLCFLLSSFLSFFFFSLFSYFFIPLFLSFVSRFLSLNASRISTFQNIRYFHPKSQVFPGFRENCARTKTVMSLPGFGILKKKRKFKRDKKESKTKRCFKPCKYIKSKTTWTLTKPGAFIWVYVCKHVLGCTLLYVCCFKSNVSRNRCWWYVSRGRTFLPIIQNFCYRQQLSSSRTKRRLIWKCAKCRGISLNSFMRKNCTH